MVKLQCKQRQTVLWIRFSPSLTPAIISIIYFTQTYSLNWSLIKITEPDDGSGSCT